MASAPWVKELVPLQVRLRLQPIESLRLPIRGQEISRLLPCSRSWMRTNGFVSLRTYNSQSSAMQKKTKHIPAELVNPA